MENQQENLTEEELTSRKEEMLKFYQESMPYLEAQFEYEKLLSNIEEQRFRRANYQMQFAMMMQGPEMEEEDMPEPTSKPMPKPKNAPEPKGRKLKKG